MIQAAQQKTSVNFELERRVKKNGHKPSCWFMPLITKKVPEEGGEGEEKRKSLLIIGSFNLEGRGGI